MPRSTFASLISAAICMLALAAPVGAQSCGMLSDPNDPACKSGTSAPSPGLSGSRAGAGSTHSAPEAGRERGRGQTVCAFFDVKTNTCLTLRPNTKDYDDAVQTGIDAAMSGMQIQQDVLKRAGEMGVMGGFGRSTLPGRQQSGTPARPAGVPQSGGAPAQGASVTGQAPPSSLDDFSSCLTLRTQGLEGKLKRALNTSEFESALAFCNKAGAQ